MTPLQTKSRNIKTWRESVNERGIGSCEARDEEIRALRAVIADEQAQAVEHVGVFDIAVTEKMAVIYYDCTKHSLKSGDKLYIHPAPPQASERAKVGDSRFESWYSELQQEDKSRKQIARAAYEAGMNEAQQVAVTRHMEEQPDGTIIEVEPWVAQQASVPVPMTNDQLWDTFYESAKTHGFTTKDQYTSFARAIEAHHLIGAKP